MPITLGSFTLEYKSLPLLFNEDGSMVITLRRGYVEGGVFRAISTETYFATREEVEKVLDIKPMDGLTRRDDLSLALYQFCISKGAEVGEIS